jgi:membrane associated rhomboid family serine protease/Zn-finger nucleic acid-binding protein
MFYCPNCQGEIERERRADGFHWVCRQCGGRTVNLSVLKKTRSHDFVSDLWTKVRNGDGTYGRPCPSCEKPMLTVRLSTLGSDEEFDACKVCQFVWFDPDEFERTPETSTPVPTATPPRELPLKAKQALALYEVERMKDNAGPVPESGWKAIPAVLGLPVERDDDCHENHAWVTWALCVIVFLVSALAFQNLREVVYQYGLIPNEIGRLGGLTMITSFFLHGSWGHLLGNLYFLYVFGDNVENRIGWRRMLILVFCATIGGDLLHTVAKPDSIIPCVGASGGISGVLAFYALAFPEQKISMFWASRYTRPQWIHMSAWTAFGLWCGLQLLVVIQQLAGIGRVSGLAHLGGVLVGGVLWLLWKNSLPNKEDAACEIRKLVIDKQG